MYNVLVQRKLAEDRFVDKPPALDDVLHLVVDGMDPNAPVLRRCQVRKIIPPLASSPRVLRFRVRVPPYPRTSGYAATLGSYYDVNQYQLYRDPEYWNDCWLQYARREIPSIENMAQVKSTCIIHRPHSQKYLPACLPASLPASRPFPTCNESLLPRSCNITCSGSAMS